MKTPWRLAGLAALAVLAVGPVPTKPQQDDNAGAAQGGQPTRAAEGDLDCQCVPYFLCDPNNRIIDNGQGLIDVRSATATTTTTPACPGEIDVCCRMPSSSSDVTPSPRPPPEDPEDPDGHNTRPTEPPAEPTQPTPWPKPDPQGPQGQQGQQGQQGAVVVPQAGCGVKREQRPTALLRILTNGGDLNDTATHFAEFPWMLAVLVEERVSDGRLLNRFKCGASLVTASVALTAAHCIIGQNAASLKVRAGEWDTQSRTEALPHQDRGVARIVLHPQYRAGPLYNDVALVFLDEPFELTDNVDTVCLPAAGQVFEGRGCYATGWGRDSFGSSGVYQKILRKVELPMVPHGECQTRLRRTRLGAFFKLHTSFVCAGGERGRDTCQGDGGGPLVCPMPEDRSRYAQVGVVAWGIGCGEDANPAVYGSVATAADWILSQIGEPEPEQWPRRQGRR